MRTGLSEYFGTVTHKSVGIGSSISSRPDDMQVIIPRTTVFKRYYVPETLSCLLDLVILYALWRWLDGVVECLEPKNPSWQLNMERFGKSNSFPEKMKLARAPPISTRSHNHGLNQRDVSRNLRVFVPVARRQPGPSSSRVALFLPWDPSLLELPSCSTYYSCWLCWVASL